MWRTRGRAVVDTTCKQFNSQSCKADAFVRYTKDNCRLEPKAGAFPLRLVRSSFSFGKCILHSFCRTVVNVGFARSVRRKIMPGGHAKIVESGACVARVLSPNLCAAPGRTGFSMCIGGAAEISRLWGRPDRGRTHENDDRQYRTRWKHKDQETQKINIDLLVARSFASRRENS